ncbi:hypothetical protein P3T76_014630 [Phytophthora citrophthora]|uniref:Uncharacterized protein n=1 Tax=Phytophthora citrophthora TaxID=4793 RepID=A0AAD9LC06_9STRA|nr:hypothetical protein P3T76_014630 [Phytophthora citrophthora]
MYSQLPFEFGIDFESARNIDTCSGVIAAGAWTIAVPVKDAAVATWESTTRYRRHVGCGDLGIDDTIFVGIRWGDWPV